MTDMVPLAVSIAEAVRISGVGRTSLYYAIRRGELVIKKRGRRSLVEVSTLKAWLAGLPEAGNRAA